MEKVSSRYRGAILLITLASIMVISVVQILSVDTTTKTEATLFNILQFIFSLFFAWFLSMYFGEAQFKASQRKFAIGAFRRIKEIERSINRTQKYVTYLDDSTDEVIKAKIIAIKGGLDAMKDTVGSSIADWSDIIGDEIEISREVNKLKKLRDYGEGQSASNETLPTDYEEKITELVQSLPPELINELEIEDDEKLSMALEVLGAEWRENKKLNLRCFWEADGGFIGNMASISVGERVFVAKGITDSRTGALIVFNVNDEQIAVITNACYYESGCNYDEFVSVMETFYGRALVPKVFGGNPLSAIVESIDEYNHENERHYFNIAIEVNPSHFSAWV